MDYILSIVEDDSSVLEAISDVIKDQLPQVKIVTATNRTEALAIIRSGNVKALLVDLWLPDINDGLAVINEALSTTIRVAVTTASSRPSAETGFAPVKDKVFLLMKPFSIEDLITCVRDLLDLK